jgi:hypothetical protein
MPDYAVIWNDVLQEYMGFANDQAQSHPSRVLVQEMVRTNLTQHLMALENYYGIVTQYMEVARKLKAQPGNTRLQQELRSIRDRLCGRELLGPYRESGTAALQALDTVAGTAKPYMLQYKPGASELKPLTDLLTQVRNISVGLEKDLKDYVTNTPRTLDVLAQTAYPDHG